MSKLQRKIMRGIYFAYTLRLVSLPGVWQGFLMLGVLSALTHFVSLSAIIQNIQGIEKSRIGVYMFNAVSTTEIWTLLLIGAFVFLFLSFKWSIQRPRAIDRTYAYARV